MGNSNRNPGYYWVRVDTKDNWEIAEYQETGWLIFDCLTPWNDDLFAEIDEKQIIRISSKEFLDKLQVSKKDDKDFDQYVANSRDIFVYQINKQEWDTQLRTTAEDLLICFDQMRERLKNK